jgi:hypothetical protein
MPAELLQVGAAQDRRRIRATCHMASLAVSLFLRHDDHADCIVQGSLRRTLSGRHAPSQPHPQHGKTQQVEVDELAQRS